MAFPWIQNTLLRTSFKQIGYIVEGLFSWLWKRTLTFCPLDNPDEATGDPGLQMNPVRSQKMLQGPSSYLNTNWLYDTVKVHNFFSFLPCWVGIKQTWRPCLSYVEELLWKSLQLSDSYDGVLKRNQRRKRNPNRKDTVAHGCRGFGPHSLSGPAVVRVLGNGEATLLPRTGKCHIRTSTSKPWATKNRWKAERG